MSASRSRIAHLLVLTALSLPLLVTGTCVNIATESIIDGFFDAATDVVVDQLKDDLGISTTTGTTSTSTTTS